MIVAKLDRLSRSLRDVWALMSDYFADDRYHLLSVCGMVNTHSAAGRMLMLNLDNFNQFERELISERTREALQHMKAQGIRLGPAKYGYELAKQLDEKGRRMLMPLASEQEIINRLAAAQAGGAGFNDIARQLNADGVRARRGGEWTGRVVSMVLQHEGKYKVRPHKPYLPRVPLIVVAELLLIGDKENSGNTKRQCPQSSTSQASVTLLIGWMLSNCIHPQPVII